MSQNKLPHPSPRRYQGGGFKHLPPGALWARGRQGGTAVKLRTAYEYSASPDADPTRARCASGDAQYSCLPADLTAVRQGGTVVKLRTAYEYSASPDADPTRARCASGDAQYSCLFANLTAVRQGRGSSLGGLLLLTILFLLAGCVQKISYQPRYEPLEQSTFFADGQASRHLVPGTVARGLARTDALLYNGMQDGRQAEIFPFQVTAAVMQRGQQRFNIYCSPCHSETGDGNGMVVQRGFPSPPSLHEDRLRAAPVGYLFDVITNGHGVMPSYGNQIPAEDRWAIIAYVRALQLSQNADVATLPANLQDALNGAAQ